MSDSSVVPRIEILSPPEADSVFNPAGRLALEHDPGF